MRPGRVAAHRVPNRGTGEQSRHELWGIDAAGGRMRFIDCGAVSSRFEGNVPIVLLVLFSVAACFCPMAMGACRLPH